MANIATLDGVFYQQYAKKIQNLMTDYSSIRDAVKFVSRDRQNGNFYNQPVTLAPEAGFTYYPTSDDAYALNGAIGSTTQNAQIMGSQITGQTNLSYAQMAKADSSTKAFVNATSYGVMNNLNEHSKRLEVAMLYGGSGLGITSATNGSTTSTQTTVTVTPASWASGIWSGSNGVTINFYNGVTLISSGADSVFSIVSVSDSSTKTITVSGTSTGITALVAATATALTIYYNGAKGAEMVGIDAILNNTGELFGIDASVYNLWESNVSTVSGTLSFSKINSSLGIAVGRGGLKEDVTVYVNPNTFNDLTNELAALRRFQSPNDKEGNMGNEKVQYFAQSGLVTIEPYGLIKNGDAFVLPMKHLIRLGATDITFDKQGATGGYSGKYFFDLPQNNGVELRSYSHQAIFLDSPAKAVYITGFTNSVN